jgi:hypothetical protein
MQTNRTNIVSAAVLLLGVLPLVTAHGGGHAQTEQDNRHVMNPEPQDVTPTYFRHPDYAAWMYAHLALMIVGWVVVLPPALMLSVARSRYHLPAQLLFHAVNALGLFTGFVYNHSTPDLYVTNSHHPVGWIVTALTVTWTILSLTTACAPKVKRRELEVSPKTFDQDIPEDGDIQQYLDSPRVRAQTALTPYSGSPVRRPLMMSKSLVIGNEVETLRRADSWAAATNMTT